jgi:putative ABC transport system ATP-binding protein
MVTHDSSIARRAPRLATIKAGQLTLTEQGGQFAQTAQQQPYPEQQFGDQRYGGQQPGDQQYAQYGNQGY